MSFTASPLFLATEAAQGGWRSLHLCSELLSRIREPSGEARLSPLLEAYQSVQTQVIETLESHVSARRLASMMRATVEEFSALVAVLNGTPVSCFLDAPLLRDQKVLRNVSLGLRTFLDPGEPGTEWGRRAVSALELGMEASLGSLTWHRLKSVFVLTRIPILIGHHVTLYADRRVREEGRSSREADLESRGWERELRLLTQQARGLSRERAGVLGSDPMAYLASLKNLEGLRRRLVPWPPPYDPINLLREVRKSLVEAARPIDPAAAADFRKNLP